MMYYRYIYCFWHPSCGCTYAGCAAWSEWTRYQYVDTYHYHSYTNRMMHTTGT